MVELELLAPAKDLDTGIAAIIHGADAVYIAANKFGAREKAGNPIEHIEKLCKFAHAFHARVYVTVNTIIYDNELLEVQKLINDIYAAGADAIIIQDYAILKMNIPPIAIHASTQMHNISPEQINFLESLGISRVVLPRELTLDEIKLFRSKTKSELEFFIHGALCVSFSGQCYMSHHLTGRSANRGACAQPCRMDYQLVDESGKVIANNKHLLSLKDLNLSAHLHQLVDAGITSFKIEGRLKDIAYVKNVTAYYSQILDKLIESRKGFRRASSGSCTYYFAPDPERTFNRGFTNHFIEGRKVNQASLLTPKSIGQVVGTLKTLGNNFLVVETNKGIHNGDGLCFFNKQNELVGFLVNQVVGNKIFPNLMPKDLPLGTTIFRNQDTHFEKILKAKSADRKISCSISVNIDRTSLLIRVEDQDGLTAHVEIPNTFEAARNLEAISKFEEQLRKTGDTIFQISQITTQSKVSFPFIPVGVINSARRQLLHQLHEKRVASHKRPTRLMHHNELQSPQTMLTYKANVANRLSREFFLEHGVKSIEKAFELKQPAEKAELMVTRYCIKHELGLCPTKQGAKPTGKLYLKSNRILFPLIFDCKNCLMKVIQPD